MDLMGIDIQALSPAPRQTYYGADPDRGLQTARIINDEMAEMVGRFPDRFVGLGTIPFQAPELAVAELDRLHKSLGFRGIEIMTHVAGEDLSAPRFRPIFARCEELGTLIFIHSDGFTEARRFRDHYLTNVIYPGRYVGEVRIGIALVVLVSYVGAYLFWRARRQRLDTARKDTVGAGGAATV